VILATSTGLYPVELMAAQLQVLTELATVVLNEHFNDKGLCLRCGGVAFPCEAAALAQETVAPAMRVAR